MGRRFGWTFWKRENVLPLQGTESRTVQAVARSLYYLKGPAFIYLTSNIKFQSAPCNYIVQCVYFIVSLRTTVLTELHRIGRMSALEILKSALPLLSSLTYLIRETRTVLNFAADSDILGHKFCRYQGRGKMYSLCT